ncbi:MAG: F0F1 ATP synthase subunit delta [Pseudomonadota bacterium]
MSETTSMTSGVAGRYATALFELALDAGQLDALESDMTALRAVLAESAELSDVLHSPIYSRDDQGKAVSAVADAMGVQSLTKNTLGLMASKRRLFAVPQMIEIALGLIAEHRGEISAEVLAAKPLTDAQHASLAEALRRALGAEVKIQTSVDASLIGGLVVKVGSRMIDTSIRAKLNTMLNAMKEVG